MELCDRCLWPFQLFVERTATRLGPLSIEFLKSSPDNAKLLRKSNEQTWNIISIVAIAALVGIAITALALAIALPYISITATVILSGAAITALITRHIASRSPAIIASIRSAECWTATTSEKDPVKQRYQAYCKNWKDQKTLLAIQLRELTGEEKLSWKSFNECFRRKGRDFYPTLIEILTQKLTCATLYQLIQYPHITPLWRELGHVAPPSFAQWVQTIPFIEESPQEDPLTTGRAFSSDAPFFFLKNGSSITFRDMIKWDIPTLAKHLYHSTVSNSFSSSSN